MRQYATLRRWLKQISQTPLHPQWFVFRDKNGTLAKVAGLAMGDILDIGAGEQKIVVAEITPQGHPLKTSALLRNLAWSKTILNWVQSKNPLLLFAPFLALSILINNCFSWLMAQLSSSEIFMPHSYFAVWVKNA